VAGKTAIGDEAAAVAAAIARFEAEFAAAPAEAQVAASPWQQAALVEGVGAKESQIQDPGGAGWLS
jgi:hypothetical protein